MKNYEYKFIKIDSSSYKEVLKLRYITFFKKFNLSEEVVIDELEKEALHLVCCLNNSEVVGYGRLNVVNNVAQISQLVVKTNFRNCGIASKLMNLLYEEALFRGAKEIFLNSRVDVIGFYKNLGYISNGGTFLSSKTKIPHVRMSRNLVELY